MANETNENVTLENMIETEVELANPPTDGSSVSVLADPDPEDTIEAYISTYEIGRGWDMEDKLEYALRDIEDAVATLQTGKADATHTHTASEVGAAASSHTHGDIYYTETEVDTLLSGKANSTHTHTIANVSGLQSALDGKAATSHGIHVSYSTTAPVMDGTASVGTASTVARSDHKHPTDTSRAAKTELDALATTVSGKANASHTHTIANITNLQTTLDGKAASGHTHSAATSSAAGLMSASDKSKLDGMVLATVSEVETYLGI